MRSRNEILFFIGRVFSPLYSLGMRLRAFLYVHHIFRRLKLDVPVISVGNLTMGGTGKTPMVLYLARLLSSSQKTVIISRGYGGRAKGEINIVSDGKQILLSAEEAGDEPRLLADSLPGVSVVTGTRRIRTGTYAVESLGASLIIMDDGFQHMALDRDVNLVLFSASILFGNGWVCPGGPLREPVSALARSDAFVITGVNRLNRKRVSEFCMQLTENFPTVPFFLAEYAVVGLACVSGVWQYTLNDAKKMALYAFCGIATPQSFLGSLTEEGLIVKRVRCFKDHHLFCQSDVLMLEKEALEAGCVAVVTTEKDYVKLQQFEWTLPVLVLKVRLQMSPEFDQYITRMIG